MNKYTPLTLLLIICLYGCSTSQAPYPSYNRIKYVDTCDAKIVNLKYYNVKPPTTFPLEKRLYQYWRVDKTDDTTAMIRLVTDTLYYSKDFQRWFRMEGK